jgi:hypothetical protein
MNGIRIFAATAAASLLLALPAAAPAQDPHPAPSPPLKPGQSAGIHAAQQAHTGLALIGTGAVIAVVIVAGASNTPVNQQFAPVTTAP